MAKLLRRMPPAEATFPVSEDEDEYSFAIEYNGPPIGYDIPRAVPIDIERIPTAAVVVPTAFGDRLALPVIQPLPSPDPLKAPTDDLVPEVESIVSPTSVIAFEESVTNAHDPDFSGDGSNVSSAEICGADAVDSSTRDNQACEMVNETEEMAVVGFSNKRDQSGEISVGSLGGQGIGASRALELSGEFASLGAMSFSSRHDETQELSSRTGSSGVLRSSKDFKESVDFSNDTNPPDWISTESVLSSRSLSSEYSSHKASGHSDNRHASSVKRASLVTFCDSEDGEMVDTSVNEDEAESIQHSKKKSDWKVRKGACYRCLKGNRFTEKEACFVCNAKYCSNCVLRAMGSMPEGRKCLTCIGYPIEESKRESLGKCSRLLKRLLSSLEIQQVIKAEKSCEMNQLQPDNIFVNGKQLCHEEMVILQSCPNPPSKLKPGSYWYDKVSGFWGKEGQKPCKIISPHLNVGGVLMPDASNGNTGIFINNREITKSECRMLQWAGVQCAGNPHFWLDADGSYQEEGQKNIRGNIWGKARTKLICSVLSLPVPSKLGNSCGEVVNQTGIALPEYFEQRILQKFLLVGSCGSGASTIFKQARLLYGNVPYSDEEREDIKCKIQSNVYRYLGILLEGRERFEEESLMEARKHHVNQLSADQGNENHEDARTLYSASPRLKAFSDWYLKVMASGNLEDISSAATREYTPSVEELWKDAAIQATYSRRSELHMLPTHASYFLEQVVDIAKMDYEPSDADILRAEGVTSANGLTCTDFSFPCSPYDDIDDDADQQDPLLRYQLIRVHAKGLGENCKWLEMFEDIRIVIFCVALSDYDVFCDNGSGTRQNKMLLNKKLFESIVTHQTFEQMDFLLVLSKFDLLEEKVGRVPLNVCDWLDDFKPVISRHNNSGSNSNVINETSMGQRAFHYIAAKFKRLFYSLTGRKLYVCQANGLEATSVDATLRFAREVIKWEEEKAFISVADNSVFSTEGSSFSH